LAKYLVTGSSGFVARHFIQLLIDLGESCQVIGADRGAPRWEFAHTGAISLRHERIDLLEKNDIGALLENYTPDYIVHLASLSSVASSWHDPVGSYQNNTNIFLNIIEGARQMGLKSRILSIGSSEEYGVTQSDQMPITEEHSLNPESPYAVARVSQELLAKLYAKNLGLDIILTRSFNHLGPGQRENFFIPSVIRQLLTAKQAGLQKCEIQVGNTELVRDFTDVRDVVSAYRLLLAKGISGEVYNVCRGVGHRLSDLINLAADIIGINVFLRPLPKLFRPTDMPIIIGSSDRLHTATGWSSRIDLQQSLTDIIHEMKAK